MLTRYPKYAGSFYPSDRAELTNLLDNYLTAASIKKEPNLKAIIVPHAGYIYSGPVAGFAYKTVNKNFDKVILLGLSHQIPFDGLAACDFDSWQTPLGDVKSYYNETFLINNDVHKNEHSIEVQLPFLQTIFKKEFKIFPILTGRNVDYSKSAEQISKELDAKTLLVVSSDLSHYLDYESAGIIDKNTVNEILKLHGKINHEQACGADGINILVEIAKEKNWHPELLDLRNSGDTAGDKNAVVGYCAISFNSF